MTEWSTDTIEGCLLPTSLPVTRKLRTQEYQTTGRYPVIDQGQRLIAGWTNNDDGLISTGLPVVVFGDHTRAFKYVDFPFVRGADGTQILTPKAGIDPRFFYYACLSIDLPSRGYNRHFKELKEKEIPIPPGGEQRDISLVLKLVDDALAVQAGLLRTLDTTKRATMQVLFTRGLRAEPQKETEVGRVPANWSLVRLSEAFESQLGKMLSEKARGGMAPKPYLRNKNVQWGYVDISDVIAMDFTEQEKAKFRLTPGDLLVCEGGVIGRAAIWRGDIAECYYQKALHRLRPRGSMISSEFLLHWLTFAFQHQNLYNIGGASSTIAHLPQALLEELLIPLPGNSEQAEIVAILNAIDEKTLVHNRKQRLLGDLFKTLLHKLMTGEIRVTDLDLPALEVAPLAEVPA